VLGPPQGVWADIWPVGEPRVHEPVYKHSPVEIASAFPGDASCTQSVEVGAVHSRCCGACGARANRRAITTTDLGGLKLFQGAGSNVLALHGDDGALMVDGGLAANADALLRAVHAATGNDRVRLLINTHWHPEQTARTRPWAWRRHDSRAREDAPIPEHKVYAMAADRRLVPVEPLPEKARPTQAVRDVGSLEFAGRKIDYG